MFKPIDKFTVRLHKRVDRYFLFYADDNGNPTELATTVRFWSETDAATFVVDRDGEWDAVDTRDCNEPVPAGFKLPRTNRRTGMMS